MSWRITVVGKIPAAQAEVLRQSKFEDILEPEVGIRTAAVSLISEVLAAQNPNVAVKVEASGSQVTSSTGAVREYLSVSIVPFAGLVE